jgi:hypothetical protein
MQINNVPNNTRKCIISKGIANINILLERCIKDASKGYWQNQIAVDLLYSGYYINYHIIDSLDNYMTRLQKLLDQKINKYHSEYNFHIYYGQIGKNNEFGYYLVDDKQRDD